MHSPPSQLIRSTTLFLASLHSQVRDIHLQLMRFTCIPILMILFARHLYTVTVFCLITGLLAVRKTGGVIILLLAGILNLMISGLPRKACRITVVEESVPACGIHGGRTYKYALRQKRRHLQHLQPHIALARLRLTELPRLPVLLLIHGQ
jgi:hypothetical protein